MIEQLEQDLYRIAVPLPENPLKELNCYFIRGGERDLIIDTGFNRPECERALLDALSELGSEPERRDVFLTHFHSDHSGLAAKCVGEHGKIFISGTDYHCLKWLTAGVMELVNGERLLVEGFPKEELERVNAVNMAFTMHMGTLDHRLACVCGGNRLTVGDYHFELIAVPGHTPGGLMLWEAEKGLMFTGDHVLFDITPNITCWHNVENTLKDYLDSLRTIRAYPVKTAYPGHRKSGDYAGRIDQLLAHHDRRIAEALQVVQEKGGMTAYEITARMTWKIRAKNWDDFPGMQKYFAVRECLAHLDYLLAEKKLTRTWKHGSYRYYASQAEKG